MGSPGPPGHGDALFVVDAQQPESPFQQELRTHLLAIQQKLDALTQRVDDRWNEPPCVLAKGPERSFNISYHKPESKVEAEDNVEAKAKKSKVSAEAKAEGGNEGDDEAETEAEAEAKAKAKAEAKAEAQAEAEAEAEAESKPLFAARMDSIFEVHEAPELSLEQYPCLESEALSDGLQEQEAGRPAVPPKATAECPQRGFLLPNALTDATADAPMDMDNVSQCDRPSMLSESSVEAKKRTPKLKKMSTLKSLASMAGGKYYSGDEGGHRRHSFWGLRRGSTQSGDRLRLAGLTSWMGAGQSRGKRSQVMNRLNERMPTLMRTVTSIGSEMSKKKSIQDRLLWRVVHGRYFQFAIALAIILNCIVTGVMADARLGAALHKTANSLDWEKMEVAFSVVFTMELVLRLVAEKILFIIGPEWRWNLFDLVLVLFSLMDVVLSALSTYAMSNVTAARIIRFVRLIRVIRIARALRTFHSLRIVVFAIFESMMSLIWCLLVVGIIIYMFSILFLYGVTEHIAGLESIDSETSRQLLEFYGSVPLAMLSLFMTISGGVDWGDAMKPLVAIHWTYQPLFAFYIFLMVIGVLNVVMGAFVAATAEIANRDKETIVQHEIKQTQNYVSKIQAFFAEADSDKSGMLSWEEFRAHLQVPQVSAYFTALELDVSQAHVLFKLLDRDGSGEVSLEEFLAGCLRLKGQAKSLEVNMLLYDSKRLFKRINELMDTIAVKLDLKLRPHDRVSGLKNG